MIVVDHLLVGSLAALGPRAVPSGIDKRPVSGRMWLGREGFTGDAQGDLKHHGGPEKAVHHYPFEHYAGWRDEIGTAAVLERPGAFGENLSTAGLTEADVAVGDTFRLGGALVQVSQGRRPCWKLNLRFGVSDMALRVQRSGRTGWYYRVLEEGPVAAGDALVLVDRLSPEWTLTRLWRVLYVDTLAIDQLRAMSEIAHLSEPWRQTAAKRLASRQVEDWSRRLVGEEAPQRD
ncbi:hypothetical protein RHODGE_RHODGE_02772 [Rhodoplanes serenus]|uniref:MOSC domain-containing protein n=2 Tax=Nitrobacteraceae TaxID=41294 RepID=A0A447CWF0_9BRAD|nr:MOSC domain-containing protein [Rhodoplanes serenus]VCU09601.1 hypothetical protein RHODGE_RHODGE_02772 [Rhodoplanes serenus]